MAAERGLRAKWKAFSPNSHPAVGRTGTDRCPTPWAHPRSSGRDARRCAFSKSRVCHAAKPGRARERCSPHDFHRRRDRLGVDNTSLGQQAAVGDLINATGASRFFRGAGTEPLSLGAVVVLPRLPVNRAAAVGRRAARSQLSCATQSAAGRAESRLCG